MHYYKRNIGDYAKKAGRLSMLEHGAYMLLIDACYDRERFPTREEAIDWCWADSEDEVLAVDRVLNKFFILQDDGVYIQPRIAEEIAQYQAFCKNQAEKGKKGGRPKVSNNKSSGSLAGLTGNPVEGLKKPKPLTTNHKPISFHPDDLAIAKEIFSMILELNPKHKKPNFDSWVRTIRLMRERDGRSASEIRAMFRWANNDSFWQRNILSPTKLRAQWDQLTIKQGDKTASNSAWLRNLK
ncbi:YdaU family protein [Solemya velum gill symbiont]|uniref:YdaU family protein n=1 Tax=Solemya velum gill symbiont TaxID=2340 RepID=UPI000996B150|nr:YdaU family protein [Solemya velum gill symbiont]